MTIIIKQLPAEELYIVEGLDTLCFGETQDQASREEYDRATWWVAWDEDTPIAYTGVYVHDGHYMSLERSGVLPQYRGQGLQKKLIQTRLRYAKRHKIVTVYTYVSSANHASVNSLFSQGLKSFSPEWPHAGEHPDEDCTFIYLRKIIKYP